MAYEKHTWENGELITAEKLNHIEGGIESSGGGGGVPTTFGQTLPPIISAVWGTPDEIIDNVDYGTLFYSGKYYGYFELSQTIVLNSICDIIILATLQGSGAGTKKAYTQGKVIGNQNVMWLKSQLGAQVNEWGVIQYGASGKSSVIVLPSSSGYDTEEEAVESVKTEIRKYSYMQLSVYRPLENLTGV